MSVGRQPPRKNNFMDQEPDSRTNNQIQEPDPRTKNQIQVPRYGFQNFQINENHGIRSNMGPHGTNLAYFKNSRNYMAGDHFKIPLDPQKLYNRLSNVGNGWGLTLGP